MPYTMNCHQESTEHTPLLDNATVPGSDDSSITIRPGCNGDHQSRDGDAKSVLDEESQPTGDERVTQYEGMPEVKASLKYILPAVGIGV